MRIPLGSEAIDGLLNGGVERGIVTAVVGEAGCGKTTFGILLALACLKEGRVIFLDTEGGLSPERVVQISPSAKLKDILVRRIPDFREQEKAVLSLAKNRGTSCVIIDSIVHNYRLLLSDRTAAQVNARLAAQLAFLNNLAAERDIPVLVTGHVYRKDGAVRLAGGAVFSYLPKAIILIEKLPGDEAAGERTATILKSRSIAEGSSARFRICAAGFA